MKMGDRGLLYEVLSVQSQSRNQDDMLAFMVLHLEEFGMAVNFVDNQIYARKGDHDLFVPYFVAHADTVHKIVANENYAIRTQMTTDGDIIYRAYDPKTGQDRGIGGDDKCGLFACLIAAQEMANVGVLITIDEEIGCVGARRVHEELLIRPGCFIQLDRRGNRDAVDEVGDVIASKAWKEAMDPALKNWDYRWVRGLSTDVGELCPMMKLSGVNLSAGYHSPHTPQEYISESDLECAVDLALDMAMIAGNEEWVIPDAEFRPRYSYASGWKNAEWEESDWYKHWQKTANKGGKKKTQTQTVKDKLFESRFTEATGMELILDTLMGYCWEFVGAITEGPLAGNAFHIYVPLHKPEQWEFEDTGIYEYVSGPDIDNITADVLAYYEDNVAPVLYENDDVGDYADVPPTSYVPVGNDDTLVRDVIFLAKNRATHNLSEKPPHVCVYADCQSDWTVYDTDARAFWCELHYVLETTNTTAMQDLMIKVGRQAREVIKAESEKGEQPKKKKRKQVAPPIEGEVRVVA